MNARNNGLPGLARCLPGLARELPALAGRADQDLSNIQAATQLGRLRARFPGWRITRTASGTFRARHRSSSARLHGRTATELEEQLFERLARRVIVRQADRVQLPRRRPRHRPRQSGAE